MELLKEILSFCEGCQGRVDLPNGESLFFCDRLNAFARCIGSSFPWIIFTGIDEARLRRLVKMGVKGLEDELFTKSGRA